MNYRRKPEQIVIPYPYLTETTELALSGITSVSKPLPTTLVANQWYTTSAPTTINVPSGAVLVVVRVQDGSQRIIWEETSAPITEGVQSGDHVIITTTLPLITIAGFDLMVLGDRTSSNPNNGLILFPSNIKFLFTESN